MEIFQKLVVKNHLSNLDKEHVKKAFEKFKKNYSPKKIAEIKNMKEECQDEWEEYFNVYKLYGLMGILKLWRKVYE